MGVMCTMTQAPEGLDLMGVAVPVPADAELAEMARCFAEEFVRMGWSDAEVMAVFRDPFYRGPYLFGRERSEQELLDLITSARRALGRR